MFQQLDDCSIRYVHATLPLYRYLDDSRNARRYAANARSSFRLPSPKYRLPTVLDTAE